MPPETAVRTHELGKRYTLGVSGRGYGTLRESLVEAVKKPLRRGTRSAGSQPNQLWALRDLTLQIESGEVVGLIGHNGAGKSTLLKILSRITEPSTGYADVTGRVGSLLEVGTGFHPELTGRENIFLNGSILGMRRTEIRARFDEITAFAEIDQFLDTPVKRYSSGMSVRLAFAVAAHLEPDILLVDEVLAVGDAAFQRKSLAKMSEVARAGRTVLFVSHNLAIIQALCKRGILLERGQVQADGPVSDVLDQYLAGLERASAVDLLEREDRDGRGWRQTLLKRIEMVDVSSGQTGVVVGGRPAKLLVEVTELMPGLECRVTIANSLGQPVATLDSEVSAPVDGRNHELGPVIECEIPIVPLLPGRYRLDVGLKANSVVQDGLQAAAFFDVEPGVMEGRPMTGEGVEGSVAFPHRWRLPP
jgi:lipopolysaccharide transport system ATP-binding protein